jgi:hypothetical protein
MRNRAYIRSGYLTLEGIVVNKHRRKHNFTVRDLTRVLLPRIRAFFTDGLWCKVRF